MKQAVKMPTDHTAHTPSPTERSKWIARVGTRRMGLMARGEGQLKFYSHQLRCESSIPVNLDQGMFERAVLMSDQYTTSNTEIPVKPGVPNTTTVRLNANFKVPSLFLL